MVTQMQGKTNSGNPFVVTVIGIDKFSVLFQNTTKELDEDGCSDFLAQRELEYHRTSQDVWYLKRKWSQVLEQLSCMR
jgi:hypothetical protein